ncbi:MAG: hypothetical protein U0132_23170 [Gemmatimonadaceae bacterium]
MTELLQATPSASELAAAVTDRELARLLSWPRERPFEGLIAERVAASRAWYAAHGDPWVATRRVGLRQVEPNAVTLETGAIFHGVDFARRVREGEAHAVMAVALTAGRAVEEESRRHWAEGRPDEGYFLDRLGAAVAEELLRWASVWACRDAESLGETVLFHLSPGCGGWPFEEQPTLMGMLTGGATSLGRVTMLESGGLTPGHSLLAVLALTRKPVAPESARDACRSCDLLRCTFRRAPFRRMS